MSQHTWVGKPAKARKRTRFAGGHLTLIVVFFYSLFFSHIRAANSPRAVLLVAANSHCWPGEGVNNNISPVMHVDSCQLPRFTCRRGASTRADNMRGGSGWPLFASSCPLCRQPQPDLCRDTSVIPSWHPTDQTLLLFSMRYMLIFFTAGGMRSSIMMPKWLTLAQNYLWVFVYALAVFGRKASEGVLLLSLH